MGASYLFRQGGSLCPFLVDSSRSTCFAYGIFTCVSMYATWYATGSCSKTISEQPEEDPQVCNLGCAGLWKVVFFGALFHKRKLVYAKKRARFYTIVLSRMAKPKLSLTPAGFTRFCHIVLATVAYAPDEAPLSHYEVIAHKFEWHDFHFI